MCFLMSRPPHSTTRTDTLFPYPTLFRSRLMAFGLSYFLLSGSHGREHARPGQSAEAMDRPPAIDFVLEKLRVFASVRPGILVEEKTLGAGLHFRLAPQYEADCLSLCMQLADETGLYLQRGKMLFELRSEEHTSELQ